MPQRKTQPRANGKYTEFSVSPVALHRFNRITANILSARRQWIEGQNPDPRRDIDDECGYPRMTERVDPFLLYNLYRREPIAARVVEVLPKESWQTQPLIYETEDSEVITPFEDAWDALGRGLRGERSHYRQEEGSLVWEYLQRVDILSGIGRYGVLFLGFDDVASQDFRNPVVPGTAKRLLYIRALPEVLAQVSRLEMDRRSSRYGQPLAYNLYFNDPRQGAVVEAGYDLTSVEVHWTRVLHIADVAHHANASEIFATPRQEPVLNRLLDIRKIYSADGEGYWKNAFAHLFFETHPQLGGDVEVDEDQMKDLIENMMNGLQRSALLKGMAANQIAPAVTDPTPHANINTEAICIKLGVPVRIFKGSERGELASSQDDAAWNDRLRQRQRDYLTPRIVVPFVDRLIWAGVLPTPEAGYYCEWPDLTSQSDQEKATVAATQTQALAAYVAGQVEGLIQPMDYLTRILGWSEEEARAVLRSTQQEIGGEGEENGEDTERETTPEGTEPFEDGPDQDGGVTP